MGTISRWHYPGFALFEVLLYYLLIKSFLFDASCVANDTCRVKSGLGQRTEGFDLSGVEEDLGENALCPRENMICCHNDDIKETKENEKEELKCSDFLDDGYR